MFTVNTYGKEDWRHLVDVSYNSDYDCENYGCNDEGICRCSKIVDVQVNTDLHGCQHFLNLAFPASHGLDQALRFWFIRRNLQDVQWGWEASGDYYGEVLDRVYPETNLYERFELFECMTDQEKIHSLLMQEYGSVLPCLKDITDWQMKPVFISEVQQTANNKIDQAQLDAYKNLCSNVVSDKRTRKEFQQNVQHLAPLCVKRGAFYQVIDGTHRTLALTSTYKINEHTPKKKQEEFVPLFMWIICPKEK